MAKGTPSNTIPLGSALLEAAGDIKGLMKALGDESKNAKADAREANKELKQAQREAKKTEDAIGRVKAKGGTVSQEQKAEQSRLKSLVDQRADEAFKKAKISSEKGVKLQAEKDKVKIERERVKDMNQFEKRINGRLMGVKDSLHSVGSKLQSSSIPALKGAGQQISNAAASIAPESLAGVVRAGGLALRAAGVAGATVGVALGAQKFVRRNVEENRIRGQISDQMTAMLKALAGKTVTGKDASMLIGGFQSQAAFASKQIMKESILAGVIGTKGVIAETFGLSESTAKRAEQLGKIFLDDKLLAERFGSVAADRLDLDMLANSDGVKDKLKLEVGQNITRSLTKVLSVGNPIGALAVRPMLDLYYKAVDEGALHVKAKEERGKRIAAIQAQIEEDRVKVLRDPQGASRRKQNALRDQSLEGERIRRNGRVQRF